MAMFAATMAGAMMRGRAGAPCACFGARSTVGAGAVVRNLAARRGVRRDARSCRRGRSQHRRVARRSASALALLACAGLAVAVLALAREVGLLRLRLGPDGALEIESEGRLLGARGGDRPLRSRSRRRAGPRRVQLSAAARICEAMRPAIAAFDRDPAGRGRGVRRARRRRRLARARRARGAPTRSRSIAAGSVLAKGRSTTSPSSRACSRPPSAAAASAARSRRSVSETRGPGGRAGARVARRGQHVAPRLPRPARRAR